MSDGFYVDGYVPPLPVGTRVRATHDSELIKARSLGTITWHHPAPTMPYRVLWDEFTPKDGDPIFGMSDIGWLTKPEEIVAISEDATPSSGDPA